MFRRKIQRREVVKIGFDFRPFSDRISQLAKDVFNLAANERQRMDAAYMIILAGKRPIGLLDFCFAFKLFPLRIKCRLYGDLEFVNELTLGAPLYLRKRRNLFEQGSNYAALAADVFIAKFIQCF